MSRVRCDVCVGTGEIFNEQQDRQCWEKCWVCDGLGELDDTPADDYYEDEWYEDDWDRQVSETSYFCSLHKAPNGHLVVIETRGYKYWGQDWGMTVGQWGSTYVRLGELTTFARRIAVHVGKGLEPGKSCDFYLHNYRIARPVRLRPWFYALHLDHVDIPV